MRKALALCCCFLLAALGVAPALAEQESGVTLMIYMSGSDLESQAGAASADLSEMVNALQGAGDLQVVVLTGGASRWQSDIPANYNVLWSATSQGLVELERWPEQSMGDPSVLSRFLQRGAELCPASRYALILWDHGAGPLSGVCFDERAQQDGLSLPELTRALEDSPFAAQPLMFMGFDACLMASVEVADAVAPYAEYLIASQEPEPASGWNYDFLSHLAEATDGGEAGERIVGSYARSLENSRSSASLSCVRLSHMDALRREIDAVSMDLQRALESGRYAQLATSRINTKAIGATSPVSWDLIDLYDFAETLQADDLADTEELRRLLEDAIVCNYASRPYTHGLSIYAPFENKVKYSSPWAQQYDAFDFSQQYKRYVLDFAQQWMDDGRIAWRDRAKVQAVADEQRQSISARLTEEELSDFARARLLVLEQCVEDEYRLLYTQEGLTPADGVLYTVYRNEALYLLDDAGEILGGPLVWYPLDRMVAKGVQGIPGGIVTTAVVLTEELDVFAEYLTWTPGENGEYEYAESYVFDDQLDLFTVSAHEPGRGDNYELGGYTKRIPEISAAYTDWESGKWIVYSPAVYTGETDWHLQFLPLQDVYDRVAMFEITDLHGNVHLTSSVPLPNTAREPVLQEEQQRECDGISLTLQNATLYTGASPLLRLDFKIKSEREEKVQFDVEGVSFDQTVLPAFSDSAYGVELNRGEEATFYIELTAEDLRAARVNRMDTLRVDMVLTKRQYWRMDTMHFLFDLPLHMGMIVPSLTGSPEPIAQYTSEEVCIQALSLERGPKGDKYICAVYMENRGPRDLYIEEFRVADMERVWTAYLEERYTRPFVLPAGHHTWCRFRIVPSLDEAIPELDVKDLAFILQYEEVSVLKSE